MPPDAIERQVWLPASIQEVWAALTHGDDISEWFGAEVELEARRGGRARFRFRDGNEREAVVETFEVDSLLVLRWMPFGRDRSGRTTRLPGTVVSFTLRPSEGGTLLRLRESLPASPAGDIAYREQGEFPRGEQGAHGPYMGARS